MPVKDGIDATREIRPRQAGSGGLPSRRRSRIVARRLAMEEPLADPILFPGTVEWTGENPGISLKEQADGPFTALSSFFRVMLSPHGRGHALILLQSPETADPGNVCLTDNEPLARWLVAEYISHFGAWKGLPGLAGLAYHKLDSVVADGDPASRYSETVKAGDLTVRMEWSGLGKPFCFALTPPLSATGKHHMPTLFVGCQEATITVNGRRLPGKPIPRQIAGQTITTAMLAFSETWIRI